MRRNTKSQIEVNFSHHAPREHQVSRFTMIRATAKSLALMIANECPDSRERSIALRKLEEAVMWANASIAREGAIHEVE